MTTLTDRWAPLVWGVVGAAVWVAAGAAGFAVLLGVFVVGSLAAALAYRWGAERRLAEGRGAARGARDPLTISAVGLACAVVAPWTPAPAWWTAAMVGAFATAAAMAGAAVGKHLGYRAVQLPSLQPAPPDAPGAVSGAGAVSAVAAATLVAVLAWGLDLLGPGEPALVTLAALLAVLVASGVVGALPRLEGHRHLLTVLSTLVGAALTLLLVWFLP